MANARWLGGLVLSVLGLGAAGCGDDDAGSGGGSDATTSVTTSPAAQKR